MKKLIDFTNSIYPLQSTTWEALEPLFTPKEWKKGAHFIKIGAYAQKIAFLESGYVRGYYRHDNGTEYNKHFFKSPCFVGGYTSLVTRQPTQIGQQALTDCRVWEADYQKILQLSQAHADIVWLTKALAEQFLVQKEHREIQLVLLEASERYQIFRKEFPDLELLIPQYHIAAYLGVSPTQLSRIRKKLSNG